MTLRTRKFFIIGVIAVVILLANALAVANWLDRLGLVAWAQSIRAEFITGTAITVIVTLVILLPSTVAYGRLSPEPLRRCPVCDEGLRPEGKYCPACGSRV